MKEKKQHIVSVLLKEQGWEEHNTVSMVPARTREFCIWAYEHEVGRV